MDEDPSNTYYQRLNKVKQFAFLPVNLNQYISVSNLSSNVLKGEC